MSLALAPRLLECTLFPYTTLFRSRKQTRPTHISFVRPWCEIRLHVDPTLQVTGSVAGRGDRTRTRQNSINGHMAYAVCFSTLHEHSAALAVTARDPVTEANDFVRV